ncbi:MAG: universal stress protein [Chitinophaga sp.]|uniref:universal stress protein n=1 Tax=Chitinophaga sp. TaxID=1869181 RepID=UPI001B2E223C|nr:universal stress protein [Chitinophaga sp.]MBO9729847.1 universal stress protein [Chitinophaga sp.]
MKKIIAAMDALHFSEQQVACFKYFAGEANGALTLVCMDNLTTGAIPVAGIFSEPPVVTYEQISIEGRAALQWQRSKNIKQLHQLCDKDHIGIDARESVSYPVEEVVAASRFADLLLISNSTSFTALPDTYPPRFVKDLLVEAACPVMVLPDVLSPIKEIIFAYNGTYSSIYAIRQFTLLFPGFADLPVKVVYVAEKNERAIPFEHQLKAYLQAHYEKVEFAIMTGEPATVFLALLIRRTDCIVTYGAFGRSEVSRFFHHSDAENILRTVNIPVFITHP